MTSNYNFCEADKWEASSDPMLTFAEGIRSAVWDDIPQSDLGVLQLDSLFPRFPRDVDATKTSTEHWILMRLEVIGFDHKESSARMSDFDLASFELVERFSKRRKTALESQATSPT